MKDQKTLISLGNKGMKSKAQLQFFPPLYYSFMSHTAVLKGFRKTFPNTWKSKYLLNRNKLNIFFPNPGMVSLQPSQKIESRVQNTFVTVSYKQNTPTARENQIRSVRCYRQYLFMRLQMIVAFSCFIPAYATGKLTCFGVEPQMSSGSGISYKHWLIFSGTRRRKQ